VDPIIRKFARIDGVVTLVDAKHIEKRLNEKKPEGAISEAKQQVVFADRLLLNKTDLVTERDLERIEARLRGINGFAPILRCSHSNVSVDSVLQLHGFDLKRTLEADPNFLDPRKAPTVHDARIKSVSLDQSAARHLRKVQLGELDLELVQAWIGQLLEQRGEDIFRMKGVLAIAHAEQRFVFHAVHMIMEVRGRGPVGILVCEEPVGILVCEEPVGILVCEEPVGILVCEEPVGILVCEEPVGILVCEYL
jgi:G3E family GTPase